MATAIHETRNKDIIACLQTYLILKHEGWSQVWGWAFIDLIQEIPAKETKTWEREQKYFIQFAAAAFWKRKKSSLGIS